MLSESDGTIFTNNLAGPIVRWEIGNPAERIPQQVFTNETLSFERVMCHRGIHRFAWLVSGGAECVDCGARM